MVFFTHGLSINGRRHPLYQTWAQLRNRCNNPTNTNYKYYGARGIRVCERWDDFLLFLADVGERPSPRHTLDRKDNSGDYEPGNVRWATRRQQARNRRPPACGWAALARSGGGRWKNHIAVNRRPGESSAERDARVAAARGAVQ